MNVSYFDQQAAKWDGEPRRIAMIGKIGQAMLRVAAPTMEADLLDYGCGTGLLGLFFRNHVRSVTGMDTSQGMLDVLDEKIRGEGLTNMKTLRLDLQTQPPPNQWFDLILSSMVMHHVAEVGKVLCAFHTLLRPRGMVCLADLESEPGTFHSAEALPSVHHFGFDRLGFKKQLEQAGFSDVHDETVHVVKKPLLDGTERDYPIFLMSGRK